MDRTHMEARMRRKTQQSGFTLVEIAIVLVIIGLLLGGILKGQELINSAKVKNLANDFRVVPTYIYAFQDKFKSLPGDDNNIASHVAGATLASSPGAVGNGLIEGHWNSTTPTDESYLFWQHVRMANLAAGSTNPADVATYRPGNAVGSVLGISSVSTTIPTAAAQIANMSGSFQICSRSIPGKFALQLDVQMDDGEPCTGSMRAIPEVGAATTAGVTPVKSAAPPAACTGGATIANDDLYTVCMTF